MKKKAIFLMLTLWMLSVASVKAQVTIGSMNDPHKGAILDLSQSESGLGVLFPKVYIFNTKEFTLPEDGEIDPKGMVIYNNNVSLPDGAGLYAWNGSEWKSMSAGSVNSCVPVTATATSVKTGTDAKITVTVMAGNPAFSYIWAKDGSTVRTTTNVTATSDTYTTNGEGTYTVTVTNPCTATPVSFTFIVYAGGETLAENGNGTYTNEEGQLVVPGDNGLADAKVYDPVPSDISGIYLDANGEIVYTGADGIPGTPDDDVYVIPEYPLPRQNICAAFVLPASPFRSGGTVTESIVLDFAEPYDGSVKYISSDPSIISIDENNRLVANSGDIDKSATITAIFEDGSIASRTYRIITNGQYNADGNKLNGVVQGVTVDTRINELIGIGISLLNKSNQTVNIYSLKSISYEMLDADGTGSTLSPLGYWLQVGSTPGTVTMKATAKDNDNNLFSGTFNIRVSGNPPVEPLPYAVTSTEYNWATLDAAPDYAGGSGTEADPYLISSVRQLKKLAMDVALFGSVDATYNQFFRLTTDLDFSGDETITQSLISGFNGTFDGTGHIIKNLIVNSTLAGASIFGSITYGELKNLGRTGGASITTVNTAGGLAGGLNRAKMTNCFNTADITAGGTAGGLLGTASCSSLGPDTSIIENCYNTGNVTITATIAGGLFGDSMYRGGTLIIKNSYNSGNVQTAGRNSGGLIGNISNGEGFSQIIDFSNSFNFGDVITSANDNRVGSIIGGTGSADPATTPLTIVANHVISRANVAKNNTTTIVEGRLIGYYNTNQQNWAQDVINNNPILKEDANYTLDYSQSAAFAIELGGAFKYAPGRTPKLAWEK
jgi:hypothetical protein